MIFTITWRKQSAIAIVTSAFLGMATGLGVWIGSAYAFSGEVSISSTGGTLACMYGTVASLFSPMVYSICISLVKPDNYDWDDFKEETLAISSEDSPIQNITTQQRKSPESTSIPILDDRVHKRWARYALWWAIATFLGHWVLWPLPMYAAKYIFSKEVRIGFLQATKGFFWAWISTDCVSF